MQRRSLFASSREIHMGSKDEIQLNEQIINRFEAVLTEDRKLSSGSARIYVQELRLFQHWLFVHRPPACLQDLTSTDLSEFVIYSSKPKEIGPESIRRRIRIVKLFFGWLKATGKLPRDPARDLAPPEQRTARTDNALTEEEIICFLKSAALRSAETGVRDVAICELLLWTGIRLREVTSLCISDVNLDSGEVQLKQSKGARARCLRLAPTVIETLRKYLSGRPNLKPTDPLFVSSRDGTMRISADTIQRVIARAGLAARILRIRVTVQTLRNSFAAQQLERVSAARVADLMGVSSARVKRSYGSKRKEHAKAQSSAEKFVEEYIRQDPGNTALL
jgi:integrase/recombinase XerD